jgi:hypothetical protein
LRSYSGVRERGRELLSEHLGRGMVDLNLVIVGREKRRYKYPLVPTVG